MIVANGRILALTGITLLGLASTTASVNITTVAGTGQVEHNGNSGPAATFNVGQPFGVELGPDGALYITEVRNHRVRRLDSKTGAFDRGRLRQKGYTRATADRRRRRSSTSRMKSGSIATGNMYFVEMQNHSCGASTRRPADLDHRRHGQARLRRRRRCGDARQFRQPHSIALDARADSTWPISATTAFAASTWRPARSTPWPAAARECFPTKGQDARGIPSLARGHCSSTARTMWIALREGHSVWRIDLDEGKRATSPAPAIAASRRWRTGARGDFNGPKGIAVGPDKNVYVVDTENQVIRGLT